MFGFLINVNQVIHVIIAVIAFLLYIVNQHSRMKLPHWNYYVAVLTLYVYLMYSMKMIIALWLWKKWEVVIYYHEFVIKRYITRYSTTANKYKPISTWTIESLHLQHHSRKWLSPGFLLQSIYTNASTWMSPGWLPLSIYTNGLYTYERFGTLERVLDVFFYRFNSRITCLQFKELLLRC